MLSAAASLRADPAILVASVKPSSGFIIRTTKAQLDKTVNRGLIVSQGEGIYVAPVFQGATLKALRNRVILPDGRRLTLRALGDRLGVSFQAVGNWEAGRNEPEAHQLPMIARELGCQVGDLFVRTLPPVAPPLIQEPPDDPGFLQEMLAALVIELLPNQSAEEAKSLAAKILAESRTPPNPTTGAKSSVEALIRVQMLLRSHKQ